MRTLRDLIAAEAALAGLLDRRERELAVLNRLQTLLPAALASQVTAIDASRSELVLSSPTGAAAALLRHRAPQLLESLLREGWKFTGMQVRVQPRAGSAPTSNIYAKQMNRASAATLRSGAAQIRDDALAAALRRLASNAEAGSEDEQ